MLFAGGAEPAAGFHNSPLPAAQCGSCHPQHYDQWRHSSHARSLTSDDFVRTFSQYLKSIGEQAQEDPQSAMACLSCHAPLLKHAGPEIVRQVAGSVLARETEKLAGFEVGCVACHVTANRVFSGSIEKPQENPFHLSKFSPSYKEASFCADCHTWTSSKIPCSNVYTDWKISRAAKRRDNLPVLSHGRDQRQRRCRRTGEKNTRPCFSGWTFGRHAAKSSSAGS